MKEYAAFVTKKERLCALSGHRLGRVPDVSEATTTIPGVSPAHYNFTDIVSGQRVYNWTCWCGLRFMATGRWLGAAVPRRRQQQEV